MLVKLKKICKLKISVCVIKNLNDKQYLHEYKIPPIFLS